MFRSIGTINAIAVHRTFGLPGDGIVWAVVDSGIDRTHPHFKKHANLELPPLLEHMDFTSAESSPLTDENGHGTACAGLIAGEFVPGKTKQYAGTRRRDVDGTSVYEKIVLERVCGI